MLNNAEFMTHRELIADIHRYARARAWRIFQTWGGDRPRPGHPDLVLLRFQRVVFVCAHAESDPISKDRADWLDGLWAAGQEAYCWRPSDWWAVEKILD